MIRQQDSLNFQEIHRTLQEKFYISVPFPFECSILEEAIQAFFLFLNEPVAIKSHIDFSIDSKHRRGDVGFKHRDPKDHAYHDSKAFFHFHPALLQKYADFLTLNPVVNNFMLKAQPIWEGVYQVMKNLLSVFEPEFPGICHKVFDTEHPHILLRFLKYDWQKSGKYLAKPHFDAGSFTLALAESSPGLRIGSCPENLQLVEHEEDKALFMFSSNFKKIINSDKLQAGWHDVIQLEGTVIGKPFSRWALVAFIDAYGIEALPRSETHKWYSESSGISSIDLPQGIPSCYH